jgi:hypothetical protein
MPMGIRHSPPHRTAVLCSRPRHETRCADDRGQLTAINQAIKQSSNQEGVFITEEQGSTIEHTEKQRL